MRFPPDSRLWSERLDNAALGDRALPALVDQLLQLPTQDIEIGDLAFDIGQVLARDRIHRRARAVLLVAEIEKRSDLIDRKAKIACPANEAEPVEVLGTVGSIVAGRSCGRREQSDTLVIADCLHLGLRRPGATVESW